MSRRKTSALKAKRMKSSQASLHYFFTEFRDSLTSQIQNEKFNIVMAFGLESKTISWLCIPEIFSGLSRANPLWLNLNSPFQSRIAG